MKKCTVLWIDDEGTRSKDANLLNDTRLQVTFVSADAPSLTPSAMAKYDLCLIDYRLEKLDKTLRGPAFVGRLRSVDDETPAYLLTNEPAASISKFSGVKAFEVVLTLAEVQDIPTMRRRLKTDIDAYRAIHEVGKNANPENAIMALLAAPSSCEDSLIPAIPASVRNALFERREVGDGEYSGRLGFARWVRRVLLARPGPLLPSLHAATRLGVTEKKFSTARFARSAQYQGIFANSSEPRWWRSELDELVFGRDASPVGLPWQIGPKLLRAKASERAKCAICDADDPDIVARVSSAPFDEHPVHQRHTRSDPSRDFLPFFAEERIFDEVE